MDATGQIFQISKFPDTPSFVILARKGSQTTRATPGDYLAPGNRNGTSWRQLLWIKISR